MSEELISAAVFIDKDGTLVENVPYNVDPEQIRLAPGAAESVAALRARGFRIFVVSNQPGLSFGYFLKEDLEKVEARIGQLLNASLHGFYYCPHRPDAGCQCRKPRPGLLLRAAREHGVDLGRSWMIGDILDDVEAGRRAGCRALLVNAGNETEWQQGEARRPHRIVGDLAEAAAVILDA